MNTNTMRRLDRWLGVPACAALTVHRRLLESDSTPRPDKPRRILFVKLAEQGATVLAEPALQRAVEMVGRDNVFVLLFEENRFILDVMDIIPRDNVIPIRTMGPTQMVADSLRALSRLRRERIDTSVDMEFFARSSAALSYLSGASRRVGFHAFAGEASYRGDLMTHRLSCNPFLHAGEVFRSLMEAVTVDPAQLPALSMDPPDDHSTPSFEPTVEEKRRVTELVLAELGQDTMPPLVLLNSSCADLVPLRRWPAERYAELAGRLLERYPRSAVVFTGLPSETERAGELVAQVGSPRCVNLAGKTSLRDLLVLCCLAELLVTNDSGPAHFAALTPVDVVTLFGPETPAVFGSRASRSHILWADLPCSPCVNAFNDRNSPCTDNLCMQRISVDQVFELVCSLYKKRVDPGR